MQPTVCTLELTGQDLQIIYAALDEFPAKQTRVLHNKISAQVQAQIDSHERLERETAAELKRAAREAIIADYLKDLDDAAAK